jgi:Zn finger protein HypA/HybF involved in hydrogenase expression
MFFRRSDERIEEPLAVPKCLECGREPRPRELWRLYFADLGEVAVYCPQCASREFDASLTRDDDA